MVAVDPRGDAAEQGPALSIISTPRTRRRNTSPMSRSRTCCPTNPASRCAIPRSTIIRADRRRRLPDEAGPAQLNGRRRLLRTSRRPAGIDPKGREPGKGADHAGILIRIEAGGGRVAFACLSGAALAQGRPDTLSMSCAQAQAIIERYGEAVLGTGPYLFERYVRSQAFCTWNEETRASWVATRDKRAMLHRLSLRAGRLRQLSAERRTAKSPGRARAFSIDERRDQRGAAGAAGAAGAPGAGAAPSRRRRSSSARFCSSA